jgi:putative restriction endonuclease
MGVLGSFLDTVVPQVHFLPMPAYDPDELLRAACFAELQRLCQQFGKDVPYRGGLDRGFTYDERRVPFLTPAKGIFRAACQRGPAALSINTSWESPYADAATPSGFSYAYRRGSIDQPDNRALRAAGDARVPLGYFVGTRPGWYHPVFPAYVIADHPEGCHVIVGVGAVQGVVASSFAEAPLADEVERVWALREARVRVHQARFRGLVLPAYRSQCAICRLRQERLLDAAHIVPDRDPDGVAAVRNGLSLCSIHHRAFDQDLVGISPDFQVHVAQRLLDEDDGPMLDLLKTFHQTPIVLPDRRNHRPSQEYLERRFDLFRKAS